MDEATKMKTSIGATAFNAPTKSAPRKETDCALVGETDAINIPAIIAIT
jgi:hypothetical protein